MARPKEFDREEALQKAMEVFWLYGYGMASIQELVSHMGINRQSLYDTFGDKHALYLLALDRYSERENHRVVELLSQPGPVRKTLGILFSGVVERALSDRENRGCLIGNAMSELSGRCSGTKLRTCGSMAVAERAFYGALLRGKRNGELKRIRDPRAVARFLYSSLQGLILVSKAAPERKLLEDIVNVTLSVVE